MVTCKVTNVEEAEVLLATRKSIDHMVNDDTGQSGKSINHGDMYYPKY